MLFRVVAHNADTLRSRKPFKLDAESVADLVPEIAWRLSSADAKRALAASLGEFARDESRPDTWLMAFVDGTVFSMYIAPDNTFGRQLEFELAEVGEFHRDDQGLQLSVDDVDYVPSGIRV